jgi:hypothetical protein
MTKEELDLLQETRQVPTLSASLLKNQEDRTLLWGYTTERDSWHVYLEDGRIKLYTYGYPDKEIRSLDKTLYFPEELIPSKRLYPEACDFEFCQLLMSMGASLPFTGFNKDRQIQQFYGNIA